MHLRHLPNLILLFLACHVSAQNALPYVSLGGFSSAIDSVDYNHFRQGSRWEQSVPVTDTTVIHYRQVWVENLHGGFSKITRGDGSVMTYQAAQIIAWFEVIPFRMVDGRRGLAVAYETPCGLICRTTTYYLEE